MNILTQEIKQMVQTIVGDIIVDVKIRFVEMAPAITDQQRLQVDELNNRLAMLQGSIEFKVEELLKKELFDREPLTEEKFN